MKKLIAAAAVAGTRCFAFAAAESNAATNAVAESAPVVVYASRINSTKDEMPSAVSVFGADEIRRSGARNLPELLSRRANLDVRTMNSNPMQSQIAMRGFGESSFGRVKVVVDGEELNAVDMEAPNLLRIPLASVERVEVIHGPSPVLYGDGAVAGVVNVVTARDDYEKKTRITAKAGSQDTYGANFMTKGGSEDDGVRYAASYDYLTSGGYRDRSEYDLHNANAGVRKNFSNGSTIGINANYGNAYCEMPGSLSYAQWKSGRKNASYPKDWARRWNYGVSLDSKMLLAEDQWLILDGSFSHTFRKSNWGSWGLLDEYSLYGYSFSPRYVNERAVAGLDNKFTLGSDLRYDHYKIHSLPENRDRHFDRFRSALFVYDELFLTDEFSVIAGARLENIGNRWAGEHGQEECNRSDLMHDYELGIVYRPAEGLKTYVKGTRFHRSPFCDEMNYTADGLLLKPERGTSLDAGFEWEFMKEFAFDANAYGMVMEDEIFFDPYSTPWVGYNRNSPSKTRRLGVDTGFAWKRDKVAEAMVRYGIVHADFGGGPYHGEDVPLVPNHRVRLECGVWLCSEVEIKGGYRFVSSQRLGGDFGNEHDKLPGYSLFDFGVHYEPFWAKGLKASFVMDNIFDRNYCDFAGWSDWSGAYYYPACGRSFMFTVSFEF